MASKVLRLALVQMKIGSNKAENIKTAVNFVQKAKECGSELVVLPECFNSPYGTKYFNEYAECIPDGDTSKALSDAAKNCNIFLVGGSIPEIDGNKLYNTCTVWDNQGKMIAKHRKVHLFDISIPNGITFMESDVLSPGDTFTTFDLGCWKFGVGICYDMRFNELATVYRNMGVHMLLYPGAFNMTTGPLHWELLLRGRAVDNQVFAAAVCGAQDPTADYIAWGHSTLVNPWGKVVTSAEFNEQMLVADIDFKEVEAVREQIPVLKQRRSDMYDTIIVKK